MYADVVVLTYQAPDIDSFTYKVPEELEKQIKTGQLVEVPFGKRNPMGIVVSRHPERSARDLDSSSTTQNDKKVVIKPISKIVLENPMLLPYQIELLKWMSFYYIAPMVNCLEAVLPPLNAKSLKTNATSESFSRSSLDVKQTLILVPTINKIPETLAKFPNAKNYVIYHSELKPSEKFATWLKILSSQTDYIFGSRSAVFTPCPNLANIIIYDEHSSAYKDERSPYFDTITVAQKIAQLTYAQLKIVDPSPKITTYSILKDHIKMQKFPTKTKVISMSEERMAGNKSPISDYLAAQIKKNYAAKKSILLFLNKTKESGHLFCRSCQNSQFLENSPDTCPTCNSPDIYFHSLNIDSLKTSLKQIIPHAKINQISSGRGHPASNIQFPVINIATASIFYTQVTKKFDLVAYIQTDSLASRPDFSSHEELFQQITDLKKLLGKNTALILQTFNPQDETIQTAAIGDYQSFAAKQLKERKLLLFPPFALLVKLTLKDKNKQKIEKAVHDLEKSLKDKITSQDYGQISILGPYQPIFFTKQPTYNIILKYKLSNYFLINRQKAIEKISTLLNHLKNLQVTVEPNSIY